VFQAYLLAAIVGFAVLFGLARTVLYFPFDLQITILFQKFSDLPVLGVPFTALMVAVSWIGYTPQAIIIPLVICVILFAVGLRWEAISAAVAALGSSPAKRADSASRISRMRASSRSTSSSR